MTNHPRLALALLAAAVIVLAVVAACAGPAGWRAPWQWDAIVLELRAPRVALGAVVGASLALAGLALQVLLCNDLAEPYVLGLSGGASAGAVASLTLGAFPPGAGAAAGAIAAAALVRRLARGPFDPARLLLAGIALGAIGSSLTGLLLAAAPPERLLRAATFWLLGGLGTPRWPAVLAPAVVLAVAGAWMLGRAERLDRLGLGADTAMALGVDVPRLRRGVLVAVVALTAATVAVAGMVGFVGLVAPHVARRITGASVRRCLPAAALAGAAMVIAADLVARTAIAPREVPVGLVTALVGGPFFLWQLRSGTPSYPPTPRDHDAIPTDRNGRPVVAARGIALGRGAAPLLVDVDLVVERGERLALVGGNGAGKTTLLRALAGIDAPRAGTIAWSGAPLPRDAARVARVGVLFQGEPASSLDVRTMVTLGLALDGSPGPASRRLVDEVISIADLERLVDRPCASLSGGEAQRAFLARALVARPGLLLLDEPTNHLDPARQAELHRMLDRLRGTCAVVIATHDLGLAATCDRVVLLAHGRIDALGSPDEVLTPARLAESLGVAVRRVDDPHGGPPLLRLLGAAS